MYQNFNFRLHVHVNIYSDDKTLKFLHPSMLVQKPSVGDIIPLLFGK